MKTCSTCGEEKPLSAFNRKAVNNDGLERYCKVCHKSRNIKHYQLNKKKYIQRAKDHRARVQKKWLDYKSCLKCEMCEEDRPWCLEFHHVDPTSKAGQVSEFALGKSEEILLNEIAKCIVVCRNCHADIHHNWRISMQGR